MTKVEYVMSSKYAVNIIVAALMAEHTGHLVDDLFSKLPAHISVIK